MSHFADQVKKLYENGKRFEYSEMDFNTDLIFSDKKYLFFIRRGGGVLPFFTGRLPLFAVESYF